MGCLFPFFVDGNPVPCGKCPSCLKRKTQEWAFRVMNEERYAFASHWIRLSYNDEHLPIAPDGRATLVKEHCQLFIKRLRYYHYEHYARLSEQLDGYPVIMEPIKYFLCGEYGTKYHRPHYHVVLLNCFEEYFAPAWSVVEKTTGEVSSIGDVYIDPRPLTDSAVAYTIGYMNKRKTFVVERYDDDGVLLTRIPEFRLMSKGLGKRFLTDDIVKWYHDDVSRNYIVLPGGAKTALPRYYADKLFALKAVNGYICPVARLAHELLKSERDAAMDTVSRRAAKRVYDEHVRIFGNADDFIRSQNEARHAAINNFQNKFKDRKDV